MVRSAGTMGDVTHDWLRSVLPTEFHHAIPRVYTTLTETYWHTTLSSFRCLVDQPVNPNVSTHPPPSHACTHGLILSLAEPVGVAATAVAAIDIAAQWGGILEQKGLDSTAPAGD